ncbi:MAG: hypothetical protein QXJ17_03465 [Nitrososphaeria archaeon]
MDSIRNEIEQELLLKELELLDSQREYIYKEGRSILVLFPKIFAMLHQGQVNNAKENLIILRKRLEELLSKTDFRWRKYLLPAQIEYVEAIVYLSIIEEFRIPSYKEVGFEIEPYLLGLLDCVGELRRSVYDKINEKNFEKASFFYKSMKEIFDNLSSFSYFDNAVPSLRRKVDLARRLIEETYVDITKINVLGIQ